MPRRKRRAQSADQAREVAETRLADIQHLVAQQAGQLVELMQQRDGLLQRVERLGEAFEMHKSSLAAERDTQEHHLRTVEDRAHAEVDRAREETKALQATLRQKERETSTIASRLETAVASVRAAEHLATEQGTRANQTGSSGHEHKGPTRSQETKIAQGIRCDLGFTAGPPKKMTRLLG
jgi:chromosome segregation ATPase